MSAISNGATDNALAHAAEAYQGGDYLWAMWKLGEAYAHAPTNAAVIRWIGACRSLVERAAKADRFCAEGCGPLVSPEPWCPHEWEAIVDMGEARAS